VNWITLSFHQSESGLSTLAQSCALYIYAYIYFPIIKTSIHFTVERLTEVDGLLPLLMNSK